MKKEITPDLIGKYLAGKCTAEEKQWIDQWYDSLEDEHDFISTLPEQEKSALKSKLQARIKQNITQNDRNHPTRPNLPTHWWNPGNSQVKQLARAAAVVFLTVGLSYLVIYYQNKETKIIPQTAAISEIKVNNSERSLKKYVLPDGSMIWLYPRSTIKHALVFTGNKREVHLTGEAFFDVAKDSLRPLLIYSGNLTTQVLGTSFSIHAYPQDSIAEVSVVTGKVSLHIRQPASTASDTLLQPGRKEATLVLMPNQKAVFSKAAYQLTKEEIKQVKLNMWSQVSLSFENTPIREVIQTLNKRFDASITAENEGLNTCTIKADFTNQRLPEIVELICKSIDAEYDITGKHIRIQGRGCNE